MREFIPVIMREHGRYFYGTGRPKSKEIESYLQDSNTVQILLFFSLLHHDFSLYGINMIMETQSVRTHFICCLFQSVMNVAAL